MGFKFVITENNFRSVSDIGKLIGEKNKVCVVAIIGSSKYTRSNQSKASFLYSFLKSDMLDDSERKITVDDMCLIEGHYDSSAHVVYLHLLSNHDATYITELCHRLNDEVLRKDFLMAWREAEHSYMRALLYLFSISHIIMLVSSGCTFDISYMQIFKTIDAIRLKLQPSVSDTLRKCKVSQTWMHAARLCSPRVLFVFQSVVQSSDLICERADSKRSSGCGGVKTQQTSMEDMLYRLLRKTRIITNTSNNSLFAVPANQEFVYIDCPTKNDLGQHNTFPLSTHR